MGIKELQQGMMSEAISQGRLQTEQAEWLMKEHKKQQEAVHRMYDEEISRQRMMLEEKLARRRALAQASVSVCVCVCVCWGRGGVLQCVAVCLCVVGWEGGGLRVWLCISLVGLECVGGVSVLHKCMVGLCVDLCLSSMDQRKYVSRGLRYVGFCLVQVSISVCMVFSVCVCVGGGVSLA